MPKNGLNIVFLRKKAIFAECWRKSPKIVIIALTPVFEKIAIAKLALKPLLIFGR
jgi:hypothetical protein